MSPSLNYPPNLMTLEPVSRTYQYRKIMKPMLERKRRARINRCLDELKDLMTGALQAEGENVAKLEKADILELTVRHLHNLRQDNRLFFRPDPGYADRFWDGFRLCAKEVSQFLAKCDQTAGVIVLKHINALMLNMDPYRQPGCFNPIRSDPVTNNADRNLARSPLKQGSNDNNVDGLVWRPW